MDFLLIMGIGLAAAIWIVVNLSKARIPESFGSNDEADISRNTPAWTKDSSEVFATGELDYVHKRGRAMEDPEHWPPPIRPLRNTEESNELD